MCRETSAADFEAPTRFATLLGMIIGYARVSTADQRLDLALAFRRRDLIFALAIR